MAPKDWDNEERKPDPHDSALSVGSRSLDDTAKVRELEDELEDMSEKVASACMFPICLLFYPQRMLTCPHFSTTLRRLRKRHSHAHRRTTPGQEAQRLPRQHRHDRERKGSRTTAATSRSCASRKLHALAQDLCPRSVFHSDATRTRAGIASDAIPGPTPCCGEQSGQHERGD